MQIILILSGLVFFGAGLLFMRLQLRYFLLLRKLLKYGLTVSGVVVDIRVDSDPEGGALARPVVKFTTLAGETRQFIPSFSFGPGLSRPFTPGQVIAVMYDPDDPDKVVLPSYGWGTYGWVSHCLVILVELICLGVGIYLLAGGLGIIPIHPCTSSCDTSPTLPDFYALLLLH